MLRSLYTADAENMVCAFVLFASFEPHVYGIKLHLVRLRCVGIFFFLSALQRYSFLSNEAHCIRSNWKRVKCAPIFTGAACVCVDFVKCLDKMSRNGSWSDRKFGNISNGYSVVCGKYGSDFNTKDRRKKAYKQKRVSTQTRTQPMRRRKFKRSTHLQRISRNSLEHIVRCSVFESFAAALQHCRCTYRIEKTSTQLG